MTPKEAAERFEKISIIADLPQNQRAMLVDIYAMGYYVACESIEAWRELVDTIEQTESRADL